jgi:hypothetical protein
MTMTHKEAVAEAVKAGFIANDMIDTTEMTKSDVEIHLFTAMMNGYMNARGLVMVPREPNTDMFAEGLEFYEVDAVYRAMLTAAPDTFKE